MSVVSAQSLTALQSANQIRIRRKHLRLAIRAGELTYLDLLDKPERALHNLAVGDLLCWKPKVGWAVADRIVNGICSTADRVGDLTVAQRSLLVERVEPTARAAELYQGGLTLLEVGEFFGVAPRTVAAWLEREGVPRRGPVEIGALLHDRAEEARWAA